MNSKTSKWDIKIIIGIVGLLIIIGIAWATIIISLNSKGSGVTVAPMSVEGDPSDKPTDVIDSVLIIGSTDVGYVSVPATWTAITTEDAPNQGYIYGDENSGDKVILSSIDIGDMLLSDFANSEATRLQGESEGDVNTSEVSIGGVDAFEIVYQSKETAMWIYLCYYLTNNGGTGMMRIEAVNNNSSFIDLIRESLTVKGDDIDEQTPMDDAVIIDGDDDSSVEQTPVEEEQ